MVSTMSPMVESDLSEVLELWSGMEGVGLNESDTPDHLRAYLDRNPGLSLVVRDEWRIIGAVLCGHDGRRGYLHHLSVHPAHRNQGWGRRLVESCLTSLSTLGILKCNIFLFADNEQGEQFWKRCGWSKREDLRLLQRQTATA